MLGSAIVYCGLVLIAIGLVGVMKPIRRLGLPTRRRGLHLVLAGILVTFMGMILPAPESRVERRTTHLDEFLPRWQFREVHTIEISAPPDRVFDAIKRVRADEIRLFQILTWIRRAGRPLPPGILNPGSREPILEVATKNGFVLLAEEIPREIAIGTLVVVPPGARGRLTPQIFRATLPPGFALAGMNFVVTPNGPGRSRVTTETRVFANSPSARRQFAAYWRLIYPGSAIIRRMWLRAVRKRAIDVRR